MKKRLPILLDFEVDKLTNSIENAISGDQFDTKVLRVSTNEKGIKKSDWKFDWHKELREPEREIYKLIIEGNSEIIQGLISISDNFDHILMHLIESAKFNRGKSKVYKGVPGNLVAFACKKSFEAGYDGYVTFFAKTQLIEHYQKTLHALRIGELQMIIDKRGAQILIDRYFSK